MIRFTVCSLFLLLGFNLSAQRFLLLELRDSRDSLAIEGAELQWSIDQSIQSTDREGHLQIAIEESLADYGTLRLYAEGYAFFSLDLNAISPKLHKRILYLEPLNTELKEVSVYDSTQGLISRSLQKVSNGAIYASKKTELVRIEGANFDAGANNPRQVFAQVTGLNIYEGSDGGLQLNIGGRGLDPNRSSNFNVRQNGYDISADVLGYPESYYTPPTEALEQIEVVKGAASLQYGTQFGGLLQFRLAAPPEEEGYDLKLSQSGGSFRRLSTFANVGAREGKWSGRAIFNYRNGAGWRSNSDYNSRFVFFDLHYDFSENQNLGVEYTHYDYLAQQAGGLTDSQFSEQPSLSNRPRNWFAVNWNLFALHHQWKPSPQCEWNSQIFGLNATRKAVGFRGLPQVFNTNPILAIDEQNAEGNYVHPRDIMEARFENFGAETRFLKRYRFAQQTNPWVWLIGAKYYRAQNSSIQGPGSLGADPDFRFYFDEFPDYAAQSNFQFPNENLALFTEHIFYLGKQWTLTPGARLEYIKTRSLGSYQNVLYDNAGNLIFKESLRDDRSFERGFGLLGIGLSYHPNLKQEWYFNASQNYRSVTFSDIRVVSPGFIVDPNINDEQGLTADLGYKYANQSWNFDFSYFNLFYNNRIGLILNDRAQRVRKNIGNAWIFGLELFAAHQFSFRIQDEDWRMKSYLNLALTSSRYLTVETANISGNMVEFIPFYNLKSGISLSWRNWNWELQLSAISSQFTDAENSEISYFGDLREGIVGPVPSYAVVDLFMNYQFAPFRLGLSLNNLGNHLYFTRRATGYPGPGIIPSDPFNFSINLQFEL